MTLSTVNQSTRRDRLAGLLVSASLFVLILAIGGSIYEHLVVDPAWPDNVRLIQPDDGGIDRKIFWIPIHAALTLLLPLALWASWRRRPVRRAVLGAVLAYLAMRVWTFAYFVPEALRFETAALDDPQLADQARTWVLLSTLRFPLVLAGAVLLWVAARRLATRV